ncbi:hypothetical protein ACQKKK_23735 [Peribacillus sp. NPDC006672]|uniref:hypothetical protein n=1 Tax=Peribacillus sp. NPDC006672 TaxID=3390606 RepID=UPI003D014790
MPGKRHHCHGESYLLLIDNDHTICLAFEAGQLELYVMGPVLVFNPLQSTKHYVQRLL